MRTLQGKLVYHNGIRKWFELKLDEPQCGQTSIQLTREIRGWAPLLILRGCRVRSTGVIDFSPTGYYSLGLYQDVDEIQAVDTCARKSPFPDYSNARPNRAAQKYRVNMYVNYSPGDHPIIFRISSLGRELRPWQEYASYILTGDFVLYGICGKGFVVDKVFGTPEAHPTHFAGSRDSGDMAMFDPEHAAAAGKRKLHLGYTCVREQ